MKYIVCLFCLLGSALCLSSKAQCTLSASVSCSSYCAPLLNANVSVSGGTPPFHGTVIWYAGSPYNPQSFAPTSSASFSIPAPNQGEFLNQVSVTVIDAMNCTASAQTTFVAKTTLHVTTTTTFDAGSGTYTLRAQFIDDYGLAVPWDLCNGGSVTYQLDAGAPAMVTTGWVLEAGFYYRLNTPLAPGPHRITWVAGQTACGESRLWCFPPGYATDLWLAPVVPIAEQNGVNISLRVGLQGPMANTGYMSDALRTAGLVPLVEPYSALGYTYVGSVPGISTTAGLLSVAGYGAPVDWVVVEVRSASSPYSVIASQPALLTRSGDVLRPNGVAYLHFGSLAAGSARIAVRHRDHLAAMTGPVVLSSSIAFVDLYSLTYSGSMFGTAALATAGGRSCLWAGDANGDGVLKYTGSANDRDPILIAVGSTTPNATVPNVYDRRDTNLDGVIKYTGSANDRDIILTNVGSTTPNNTRTQQLP